MSLSKPVAILMGKAGVGKTSFYNKLCETDHVATYSSKSLTRQLYRSEVIHGGQGFIVIDTPGTDSKDEVFKHSFLLKEAMTSEPVNAIFAMVEFNERCDSALDEFDKTIAYLKDDYKGLVVVVVCKFDKAPKDHLHQAQSDYRALFKDEGFPRIMFHSLGMSPLQVTNEMLGFMKQMVPKQLEYEEKDFLMYFRVHDESRAQKKEVSKLEGEIHQIMKEYKDMLNDLGSIDDKDDIIMAAIASSRYDLDQIYEKFTREFGERMIDLDCFTNSITLQKIVERAHRDFREFAKEHMSYNPDNTQDWRNSIRKCQFCGLVWVKVSGCNGSTTCGNRDNNKDVAGRPWFRYIFQTKGGKRTWTKNAAASEQAAAATSTATQKAQGCGKSIVWTDQPRLSEQELQKCFEVKGLDNLIMNMQQKPEFDRAMTSCKRKIDTSFTK